MQKSRKAHEIVYISNLWTFIDLDSQCKILCYTVFKYPDQSFKHLVNGLLRTVLRQHITPNFKIIIVEERWKGIFKGNT